MAKRILVAYYTHSGNTEKAAKGIAEKTGGALLQIEPETAYPKDYNSVVAQGKKEIQAGYKPPLKTAVPSGDAFDVLIVGTPNWWSTMAPPLASFLTGCDLSGKTILPFCTHGGGGKARVFSDVGALCPQSMVKEGLAISGGNVNDAAIGDWLKGTGVFD